MYATVFQRRSNVKMAYEYWVRMENLIIQNIRTVRDGCMQDRFADTSPMQWSLLLLFGNEPAL